MDNIKLFLSLLVSCLLIDMVWLGLIAKKLYANSLGDFLRKNGESLSPNWTAAAVVYFAIAAGIMLFVLPKADGSYSLALLWGGIYGALTYAIYDFTNLATLSNWPLMISLVDTLWGALLCAITTVIGVYVKSKLQ